MIHFQPEATIDPAPYAEAVTRLRSVRKALALVEMFEGRPRRDPDGKYREAVVAFRDITERRLHDQELKIAKEEGDLVIDAADQKAFDVARQEVAGS